jgi:hypothetical protein
MGLSNANFMELPSLSEVIAHSNSFTSLHQFATESIQLVDLECNRVEFDKDVAKVF